MHWRIAHLPEPLLSRMATTLKASIVVDKVNHAFPSSPHSIAPTRNEARSFGIVFQEHMKPSNVPISHESTSVLLLSYDSNNTELTDMDVRDEVIMVWRNDLTASLIDREGAKASRRFCRGLRLPCRATGYQEQEKCPTPDACLSIRLYGSS
jgi:hypothetical protein